MKYLMVFFTICTAMLVTMMAIPSQAAIMKEVVPYKSGDAQFEGYLAYDDSIKGQRPAILSSS